MANDLIPLMKPKIDFIIDKKFYPAVLWNHSFLNAVHNSKKAFLYILLYKEGMILFQLLNPGFFLKNLSIIL